VTAAREDFAMTSHSPTPYGSRMAAVPTPPPTPANAGSARIAAGDPVGFDATDLGPGGRFSPRGHAIECRINAEDPARRFLPAPGTITRYREPGGPGVRVDSGFGEGDEVPRAYDSLIAKLIAWAPTREEARRRMLRALGEFRVEGISTTIPAHRLLLEHPDVIDGSYTTRLVEGGALDPLLSNAGPPATDTTSLPVLMVNATPVRLWHPSIAGSISAAQQGAARSDGGHVVAPMHGTILTVLVADGDQVRAGQAVAVLEAMKMETQIPASGAGRVRRLQIRPGDIVEAGQTIAEIA